MQKIGRGDYNRLCDIWGWHWFSYGMAHCVGEFNRYFSGLFFFFFSCVSNLPPPSGENAGLFQDFFSTIGRIFNLAVYTTFISNNRASFHLWWKKNLVKHQRVSKYYENDYSSRPFFQSRFKSRLFGLHVFFASFRK